MVDGRAEKVTCFFVACEPNPATKVKVTEAMQVKGDAANLTLQQQVLHTVVKVKGEVSPHPKSVAVSSLGPGDCVDDWLCPPQCNCLRCHHCCCY